MPVRIGIAAMSDTGDSSSTRSWLIAGIVALFLAISNPTEEQMVIRVAEDGWVPTRLEHKNFVVCRLTYVEGFTGAKATYLGALGNIWKLDESK
jgi:hypothetical protein